MKALSKPVKESGEYDADYEVDMITEATIFEAAEEFSLNDDEICELLESAFGEECFCEDEDYDDEDLTNDLILSICESAEAGDISIDDCLELVELLQPTGE